MKILFNYLHKIRSKLWTESNVKKRYHVRLALRSYIGIARGFCSAMLGRVHYEGDYRPLILGPNIDFDLWSKSAIVLTGSNNKTNISDPANPLYPTASSIGVYPHYDHMNPSMGQPTRLRIKNGAKLILEPNTHILLGAYIAIAPNKTLSIGSGGENIAWCRH